MIKYKPLSFKSCLVDAAISAVLRLPIAALFAAYFMLCIQSFSLIAPGAFISLLSEAFPSGVERIKLFGMWVCTFLAFVLYPYFRTRNPRYIAKQEAYERMQAERAAKQAAANEPGAADKPGNDKTS